MNLHLWFEDRVGLHGFTVSYGTAHQLKQYACQQRRVPNGNVKNLQSRLLFSGYANFSYFTLLFGRVRLRKVQNALAKLLFCSVHLLFCLVLVAVAVAVCKRFPLQRSPRAEVCCCMDLNLVINLVDLSLNRERKQ